MLDKDRVYHFFLVYAGLDEQASAGLRPLCDASAESLAVKLREGVDLSRHMERLCLAAAGFAFCDWCELGTASSDEHEVRVGEITLRSSASAYAAAKDLTVLREHFLESIADLLKPRFVFGQVEA